MHVGSCILGMRQSCVQVLGNWSVLVDASGSAAVPQGKAVVHLIEKAIGPAWLA